MLSEPVNSEKSDPPYCTVGWITFFRINWLTQHINFKAYKN